LTPPHSLCTRQGCARVTAAAGPTYFPSVDGYIDGGVFANNPSLCALAQSQDARFTLGVDLKDIALLSLGTGQSLFHLPKAVYDWGYAQWVKPLIRLMLDGVNDIARYQCEQFLGKGFHRLNPDFPADVTVDLDAVDKIPYMMTFATNLDLQPTLHWLRQNW